MVWAYCGCFCQLLNKQLDSLGIRFPGPTHPPTPLTHPPLIHDTCDIAKVFINLSKTSYFNYCNSSCKTGVLNFLWCKSGVATSFTQQQCLEYFKFGFLKIQNVTIRLVFLIPVTIIV